MSKRVFIFLRLMGKGRAVAIELNDVVRRELTTLTRKHGAPQALAERARIVLAAAGGLKNKEIASKLGRAGFGFSIPTDHRSRRPSADFKGFLLTARYSAFRRS